MSLSQKEFFDVLFGENWEWVVVQIKLAASSTQPITIKELTNKVIRFVGISSEGDIEFESNIMNNSAASINFVDSTRMKQNLKSGGSFESPILYRRYMDKEITFSVTNLTASTNDVKIEIGGTEK